MASAMRVFRKFQSSDGRIKVATLSGVSVLVAVIALLVGVLPVFANHLPVSTTEGVTPVPVDWGGGSGACDDALISLEDGKARGPSAADWEAHLNNPQPGTQVITGNDPAGTEITITVDENDQFFEFSVEPGMAAYDVVVNGGKKSNHYELDGGESGILQSDADLSAPVKDNRDELHNLSHINICYDAPVVTFECDAEVPEEAFRFGDGLFVIVTGQIFANSEVGCDGEKVGVFFVDNQAEAEETTLDFGEEGGVVAGRLDFTRDFGDPITAEADPLEYDRDDDGNFRAVQWCNVRGKDIDDGSQFDPELGTDLYPTLDAVIDPEDETVLFEAVTDTDGELATACKVSEDLNADGIEQVALYFEFEDPNFR